mgnify:CR=1 FL=1
MADITVRGIPDEVYERLKQEAERRHRSLNQEIVHRIEASVRAPAVDPEEHLERIRATRRELGDGVRIDDALLERARSEGRP